MQWQALAHNGVVMATLPFLEPHRIEFNAAGPCASLLASKEAGVLKRQKRTVCPKVLTAYCCRISSAPYSSPSVESGVAAGSISCVLARAAEAGARALAAGIYSCAHASIPHDCSEGQRGDLLQMKVRSDSRLSTLRQKRTRTCALLGGVDVLPDSCGGIGDAGIQLTPGRGRQARQVVGERCLLELVQRRAAMRHCIRSVLILATEQHAPWPGYAM